MRKGMSELKREARRLYLSGEMQSNAEIAAFLKVKPHTIGTWRKLEQWDDLRRKAEKNAADQMAKEIATDNVNTNLTHFRVWGVVLTQLVETLTKPDALRVRLLHQQSVIAERMQRGQRLSRGFSLDGQTEEKIRAEAVSEMKRMVDRFIEVIKECVTDEETQERIASRILSALPQQAGLGTQEPNQSGDH
jgi:hypothetical protein